MNEVSDKGRLFVANCSLFLFIAGLLVPFIIAVLVLLLDGPKLSLDTKVTAHVLAVGFGVIAEVLALILGIIGRRHLSGKVGKNGSTSVLLGAVLAAVGWSFYSSAGSAPPPNGPLVRKEPDASEEAAAIRALIPAAAGMRNADMDTVDKIAAAGTVPRFNALQEHTLSVILMVYGIHPPGLYEAQAEELRFGPNAGGESLAKEIRRTRQLGYYSMIQPDRITDFTCKVDGKTAKGIVSFKVPDLYQGRVPPWFVTRA